MLVLGSVLIECFVFLHVQLITSRLGFFRVSNPPTLWSFEVIGTIFLHNSQIHLYTGLEVETPPFFIKMVGANTLLDDDKHKNNGETPKPT